MFGQFTFILCKGTGEPITELSSAQARRMTKSQNLPMAVGMDLNIESSYYPSAVLDTRPRLKVWRPSTTAELTLDPTTVRKLAFYGTLPPTGTSVSMKERRDTVMFQSPTWMLNRREVQATTTFAATDQGSILWQLIVAQQARTNGDMGLVLGNVTTGIIRDMVYEAGKNMGTLIDEMTKIDNGCDIDFIPIDYWELDRTNKLGSWNAYARQGTDRPNVRLVYSGPLTGYSGGLGTNVEDILITRADVTTQATSVGSDGVAQTYGVTTSPFGVLEDWDSYGDISDAQTLMDKSVGKVANRLNAPMIIQVKNPTSEAPQPFTDYDVGDIIYVSGRAGGLTFYDLPARVAVIDITIDQQGAVQTTLTLSTLPENVGSVIVVGTGGGGGTTDPGHTVYPPGNEAVSMPSTAHKGQVHSAGSASADTYTKAFHAEAPEGGESGAWVSGKTVTGLVVGHTYRIFCQARGPDESLVIDDWWSLWVGTTDQVLDATSTLGPDYSSTILNTSAAIRITWREVEVVFTATAETMYTGWYTIMTGNWDTYTTVWQIEPA